MVSELGSFCASQLGAFIASPLGARDCEEPSGELPGCCCYTWLKVLPHPRGYYFDPGNPNWAFVLPLVWDGLPFEEDEFIYETVLECATRPRAEPSDDDSGCRNWAARQTHSLPYPGVVVIYPFCILVPGHTGCFKWTISFYTITYGRPGTFASWRVPCRCESSDEDPNAPPDTEERCSHEEGYCCALVLGHWEWIHKPHTTWARYCNAATQQFIFADPIQDMHFDPNPEDPNDPCPDDPTEELRGWCCVTMMDGTVFHANPTGDGSNTLSAECTIEFQQEVFSEFGTPGQFIVVAVQWLGEVSNVGCDPCGVPEGSCCFPGPHFTGRYVGNCIHGVTEAECDGYFSAVFNPALDQCANCYEPPPLPDRPPWLGPLGRCCTTFQFHDGAQWQDQWKCREVTTERCDEDRAGWEADDRFRRVVGEPWTLNYKCKPSMAGDSLEEHLLQCGSEQAWCCLPGNTQTATWMVTEECLADGGTPYDPRLDPALVCRVRQPCCLPDADGVVRCSLQRAEECRRLGGLPMGEEGDDCDTVGDEGNPVARCEVGACCLGCSRCVDNMAPWNCAQIELHPEPFPSVGGIYKGDGSQCHRITDCPTYDLQQGPP